MLSILMQISMSASDSAAAMKTGEATMSYWKLTVAGGPVMIPIFLLSFLAIYIFIERFYTIKNASKIDSNFMNRIRDYIHDGKIDSALALCQSMSNPAARMIEKGINRLGRPLNDVQTAIENVGQLEVYKLEKGLALLATSAGAAPMLGFLGTVTGMVRAFYDMASAGNNIDIQLLSSGIYQAMVTTVAGLIVGILAYFAYNFLITRVHQVVNTLEIASTEFMDLLNEPVK
jgi:biopolymer transport protein ExbB